MQKRRSYTDEFKIAAVHRWEEVGNFNEVGRELGIASSLIRKWKEQFQDEGEQALPGKGHVKDEEMVRVRRENARLKEENTILKNHPIALNMFLHFARRYSSTTVIRKR